MPPLADFACLSKKCDKKGRAVTYELPINAVRCPVCGSKKIKRLFNRVNVNLGAKPAGHFDGRRTSSSMARRLDALVEEPVSAALAKRDELKKAALPYRHDGPPGTRWKNDNGMVRTVPAARLGGALREIYNTGDLATGATPVVGTAGELTQKATLSEKPMPGILSDLQKPGRPPTEVVIKDTQYRVVKHADGSVEGVGT